MSKWVPDWVTHFEIEECDYHHGITISFYQGGDFISGEDGFYPISELEKELSIRDVCQQIKNKPATLDEAFANQHSRMDVIGQNGNTGEHYKPAKEPARSKYHKEIKPGVWVDVYDVLNAFGVECHALAHGIKKLLMPGQRGAKGYKQDCEEAIQSINRSIDEWG